MKRIFILAAILLSACQTSGPKNIDLKYDSSLLPGTIVRQSSKELGNGFYKVSKSIVNPPEIWQDGLGHFVYVYHGRTKICQCETVDVEISPKGEYIVYYSHQNKQWELFNTRSNKTSAIAEVPIGYPRSSAWDLERNMLELSLSGYRDGKISEVHQIALD